MAKLKDLKINEELPSSGVSSYNDLTDKPTIPDISSKQDTLVSGTNIKTINSESLLGAGNIVISGGGLTQQQIEGLI